jgi:hypothetical protein
MADQFTYNLKRLLTLFQETWAQRDALRMKDKIEASGHSADWDTQGRKSLGLCWTGLLRIARFDPVAKLSELPDHLPSAPLLRFFGDRWAPFLVTDSLV